MAFTDPVTAIEHIEVNHDKYKLVLSDVRMPTVDGIELAKRIFAKDKSHIALLLMSAFDQPDILGIEVEFVQKPITVGNLQQIVSTKVNGHASYDKTSLTIVTNSDIVTGSCKILS